MVIISSDPQVFKAEIELEFYIKYLGNATFVLGMNINRTANALHFYPRQ